MQGRCSNFVPVLFMQLNQVTVFVLDIDQAIAFYQGLGLELIVQAAHYARFLADNGATFSVHRATTVQSSTVVYFECLDLDARCRELVGKGYVFEQLPTDQTWLWREAYLLDPSGNRICLYFAGEMRSNPPWRVPKSAS